MVKRERIWVQEISVPDPDSLVLPSIDQVYHSIKIDKSVVTYDAPVKLKYGGFRIDLALSGYPAEVAQELLGQVEQDEFPIGIGSYLKSLDGESGVDGLRTLVSLLTELGNSLPNGLIHCVRPMGLSVHRVFNNSKSGYLKLSELARKGLTEVLPARDYKEHWTFYRHYRKTIMASTNTLLIDTLRENILEGASIAKSDVGEDWMIFKR